MKFFEYHYLVRSDLHRSAGKTSWWLFFKYVIRNAGFKYIFWMRTCRYLFQKPIYVRPFYYMARIILEHYEYKYGVSIPFLTDIGSGLYIGHVGGIVVNVTAKIGKNCYLAQGITVGQSSRGDHMGNPVIGDNVYIGAGAKVIGNIRVGDNVAIGANAVVTKDVPDSAVVVGIPAKVISYKGSEGYIERTDYE
jgi:serine O-acetyltransferase